MRMRTRTWTWADDWTRFAFLSQIAVAVIVVLGHVYPTSDASSAPSPLADDSKNTTLNVDPNGYIAYCPCMGRFGNQADQFLGALAFSKELNRTLILPPWVEYIPFQAGSLQTPFDTYFDVKAFEPYHRVVTMEVFMKELAPAIWPPAKRISFCYVERNGKGCDAKDGNPFGPFWDKFVIDFIRSEIFGPDLHYVTYPNNRYGNTLDGWKKYSGKEWPVLAFVGPPSAFPVEEQNIPLQRYLRWNSKTMDKANSFIKTLVKGPFIGIHLRNGVDWSRACELVDGVNQELFASPQCTGYQRKGQARNHPLTYEMCFPSWTTVIKQLKRVIKKIKATSVFIASDKNHLVNDIATALKNLKVQVAKLDYESPHVDLAILGQSNYFIGNCVSSFSAFVKRERDVNGLKSEFWAYPPDPKSRSRSSQSVLDDEDFEDVTSAGSKTTHDEL